MAEPESWGLRNYTGENGQLMGAAKVLQELRPGGLRYLEVVAMEKKQGPYIKQPFKERPPLFTSSFPQVLYLLDASPV